MEEDKEKKLIAGMEKFIAEQNASATDASDHHDASDGSSKDVQMSMTEKDFENTALLWFPEKAEIINRAIDDVMGFAYGYLDGDFSRTLIALLEEWKDHPLIRKYSAFLELIWRKGDPFMQTALSVTAIEALACRGEPVWRRFGYYLSEEFRAWINDVSVPGNIVLNPGRGTPLLTSLYGHDLTACRLRPGQQGAEPVQKDNFFMLGSYHIIAGRIERFCNHPERLQKAFRDLKWANIDSEYHRLVFRRENEVNDCLHIVVSRFPAGFLRKNIVDAFLHTMLIIHQLTDIPDSADLTDLAHFSRTEEEWNKIPAEQRCTDGAAALERFYTNDVCWENILIGKNPETGTPEWINTDDYSHCDEQACEKPASLLTRLPANMELIGGNADHQAGLTETYIGAENDCFMTVILQESYPCDVS